MGAPVYFGVKVPVSLFAAVFVEIFYIKNLYFVIVHMFVCFFFLYNLICDDNYYYSTII